MVDTTTRFPGTQGIWWGGLGGGGDNRHWNIHTYSMLHVLQGRRTSGGVGWVGGLGEVITFVGTFTHIPYYIFARVRRTFLCRFEPDQKRMSSEAQDLALAIVIKDPPADPRCLRAGQSRQSSRHAHMVVATPQLCWSAVARDLSLTRQGVVPFKILQLWWPESIHVIPLSSAVDSTIL